MSAPGSVTATASSGSPSSAMSPKVLVELALRLVVMVFALAALIAAAVAVGTLNDAVGSSASGGIISDVRGASGWIIFVAIAAIATMALFIVLRIVSSDNTAVIVVLQERIWAAGSMLTYFPLHIQGMVVVILLGLSYFAGGVAAARFAGDLDSPFQSSESQRVESSLGAAAAFCFFSDVVLFVLLLLSVVSLVTSRQ